MFDNKMFEMMPKYADFKYWFICQDSNSYVVTNQSDGETICTLSVQNGVPVYSRTDIDDVTDEIFEDFKYFLMRPESSVSTKVDLESLTMEAAVTEYEKRLVGVAFIRARRGGVDPDTTFNRICKCLDWLRTTDMYTGPASTQYHESFPGGLLHHSLNVFNRALELSIVTPFKYISYDSIALVALVHDWCKIGLYEPYKRNVQNEETGKWEKKDAYRRKQTGVPLGHGVSSMFLASKFFRLSTEESLAIRWHMGAWRVVNDEINELQMANEKFPLVHMLQFADQLAIVEY